LYGRPEQGECYTDDALEHPAFASDVRLDPGDTIAEFSCCPTLGLDKPSQIMYARCVRWFIPENMTGAKLLGMHETETSPTVQISACAFGHVVNAGVVQGSYADDVGV